MSVFPFCAIPPRVGSVVDLRAHRPLQRLLSPSGRTTEEWYPPARKTTQGRHPPRRCTASATPDPTTPGIHQKPNFQNPWQAHSEEVLRPGHTGPATPGTQKSNYAKIYAHPQNRKMKATLLIKSGCLHRPHRTQPHRAFTRNPISTTHGRHTPRRCSTQVTPDQPHRALKDLCAPTKNEK